jgi:hypothetical protein
MTTKTSSTSSVLIIILIVLTFPIWIGLAGGIFGIVAGLFGAAIGIIAGVFGTIFGLIGAILGGVFSIFDWDNSWHFPFVFHPSGLKFVIIAMIIFGIVLLSRTKKTKQ